MAKEDELEIVRKDFGYCKEHQARYNEFSDEEDCNRKIELRDALFADTVDCPQCQQHTWVSARNPADDQREERRKRQYDMRHFIYSLIGGKTPTP